MRTDAATDAMSKTVKVAAKIEETSSDVIDYGMVSYGATLCPDKVWRGMLSFLFRPAESRMQVDGVSFQETGGESLTCTEIDDPSASVAFHYTGSDSGETVDVKMDSFVGEAETIDATGSGQRLL